MCSPDSQIDLDILDQWWFAKDWLGEFVNSDKFDGKQITALLYKSIQIDLFIRIEENLSRQILIGFLLRHYLPDAFPKIILMSPLFLCGFLEKYAHIYYPSL